MRKGWSVSLENSQEEGPELQLSRAILLYESGLRNSAMATVCRATPSGGMSPPTLSPGELLTMEGLEALLAPLKSQGPGTAMREIFPEHLLFSDGVRMLWYRTAQRRPIYFKTSDVAWNKEMNGANVWHPALLFLAQSGKLSVFALESDARPCGVTPLCRAPYFNLYSNGMMCAGNSRPPTVVHPSQIEAFETCFFETNFTHANIHGGSLAKGPEDGHDGFWRAQKEAQGAPPPAWLLPLGLKVQEVLNGTG